MKTTTIRIPKRLEQFLERSEHSATKIARSAIRHTFYEDLAGVCAKCGEAVFAGDGHTVVSVSTPLGDAINPEAEVEEFILSEECSEQAHALVSQEDPDEFELEYLQNHGGYLYDAIRQAVADLEPNGRAAWCDIIRSSDTGDNPLKVVSERTPEKLLADLIRWASWKESTDRATSDYMESVDEYTVSELLSVYDNPTIGFMYKDADIADLIEDGVIPETADEAIEMGDAHPDQDAIEEFLQGE